MNAFQQQQGTPEPEPDPGPAVAAAAVDRAKTEYVVLGRQVFPGDETYGAGIEAWRELLRADASNADTALKIVAETHSGYDAYVAIPARSFQPKSPTVETRKIVKFA